MVLTYFNSKENKGLMTKLAIIPCTVLLETLFFIQKVIQAITLFITGPFLDGLLTNMNVFAFEYTPQVLAFIVLSCLISVSVNFSTFLVIGKTSLVTYQVLGYLKTCLVLAFGYVLLWDPFSWRNILVILVAVVGMGLYSDYCTVESQQKVIAEAAQVFVVLILDLFSVCYSVSFVFICVRHCHLPPSIPLEIKTISDLYIYIQ